MKQLVVIAYNLRSAHNVGSLLRTTEGLGVQQVILCGYTPYPPLAQNDSRLPHEQARTSRMIDKTALGAASTQTWNHQTDLASAISELRGQNYSIAALEQAQNSYRLPEFKSPDKLAILLGSERDGLEPEALALCDYSLEIPMLGQKESYNVVQAAAMALYHCRFIA